MSLGGKKNQSTTDVRLLGIAINQSTYGNAIALVYGQNRIPLTLLWYGNFVATPHTAAQSGGKGGGGGSSNTTYTYTASIIMGLCEGPITGIVQVFKDKTVTTLAAAGLTLFNGAGGQAVWSYLTTNFPTQAVPYDHTAYLAVANYALGSSAALPNYTFETTGFLPYNAGTINDAEPSAILIDYCTDPNHSCNFNSLGAIQGAGVLTYQSYCIAMGFFISPYESTQRPAVDFIKETLQLTNSNGFMSAGVLNILPYADASVSGNGRTYIPNLAPIYSFTDDDFMPGSGADPVVVSRLPLANTYNTVRVEYLNRANAYNTDIAEATDAQDIALNGVRVMATLTFHQITTLAVARQVAQLILQRQLYLRSTFVFAVRPDYCLLEPMDLVSITDSVLGISNKLIRITQMADDANDNITITAEDMLVGSATAPLYNWQASQGYASNYGVAPPSVAAPLIFTTPPLLVDAGGGYELSIAVDQGAVGSWGGCDVYMSLDNVSYIYAGTVNGAARYGTLVNFTFPNVTDPDTTSVLEIALTNAATTTLQLMSGSAADYANLRTLMFVDGEIIAYQNAVLNTAGQYNLTHLRRGLYGSVSAPHAIGSSWARIDAGLFRVPYDAGMIGQTVYFKFASFNIYQQAYQSLAACTAYTHVLAANNAGQLIPGALTLIGSGIATVGSSAFKSAQTSAWDSSCYSAQSYPCCSAACYSTAPSTAPTADILFGLSTNPSAGNSYTNINYAMEWFQGSIYIYESGVAAAAGAAFGTYTTVPPLLNVVYDGKHVAYYINGALVRSIPITGLTLFFQAAIRDGTSSLYGIDFLPVATVVTPFTLTPLNGNTAAAGTAMVSNNQLATTSWGNRLFQSKESLTGGCIVSFSPSASALVSGAQLCVGLATAPTVAGTAGSSAPVCWQVNGASLELVCANGAGLLTIAVVPLASDVYSLSYDNFNFRWLKNGVQVFQLYSPSVGPLFLSGDFEKPNTGIANVSFAPYSSATPQQFIARGQCVVADTNCSKEGGSTGWNSDFSSINSFPKCHVVWKANDTANKFMVALSQAIQPSTNYLGLDFAIYCTGTGTGLIYIYESGVLAAAFGAYAATDYLAITYDGATITYWQNSRSLRAVAIAGKTFFATSAFFDPGAACNSLEFGPSAVVPLLDTPQLGVNAASVMTSAQSAATVVNTGVHSTLEDKDMISVTVTTSGFPVAIDAACSALIFTASGSSMSVANLKIYRDGAPVAGAVWDPTNGGTIAVGFATMPQGAQVTLTVTDTPAAGTHTYTLHSQCTLQFASSGSGNIQTSNNFIKVREIKK